jgi:hypothetical protein
VRWSRIANPDEWKPYLQHVVEMNDNFKPNVICAVCRKEHE